MFERYTEKARRAIFFSRYEASQFGSTSIESEHLLLGLLREDKALAHRFLKSADAINSIRSQLSRRSGAGVSTSVDLPLSHESKRILAYGAEECERLNHKYIGSPHLFLGILREQNSLAAKILSARGVELEAARHDLAASLLDITGNVDRAPATRPAISAELLFLLSESEKAADITVATSASVAGHSVEIAIYEGRGVLSTGDPLTENEETAPITHAVEVARLRRRIRSLVRDMENAIATHEFEKARFFSDEERRLHEELRLAFDRKKLEGSSDSPDPVPFLCILLLADESLTALRTGIEALFRHGVRHVWMIHPSEKRLYTATPADGLREFTGEILQIENPKLEIDPRRLLDAAAGS